MASNNPGANGPGKPVQNGNAEKISQPKTGAGEMPRVGGHTSNNGNGKPGV